MKQVHTHSSKEELLVNQLLPEVLYKIQEGQIFNKVQGYLYFREPCLLQSCYARNLKLNILGNNFRKMWQTL